MVSLIFDFKQVYCNNIQALISSTLHTGSPETKLNTTERSYLWSAMSSNKSISKVSSRPSSGWTKTLINHHDLIFLAKIIHINMLQWSRWFWDKPPQIWLRRMTSRAALPPGYPLGDRGSTFLSQPAEWWEQCTGQLQMLCYFLPLCSMRGLLPGDL